MNALFASTLVALIAVAYGGGAAIVAAPNAVLAAPAAYRHGGYGLGLGFAGHGYGGYGGAHFSAPLASHGAYGHGLGLSHGAVLAAPAAYGHGGYGLAGHGYGGHLGQYAAPPYSYGYSVATPDSKVSHQVSSGHASYAAPAYAGLTHGAYGAHGFGLGLGAHGAYGGAYGGAYLKA